MRPAHGFDRSRRRRFALHITPIGPIDRPDQPLPMIDAHRAKAKSLGEPHPSSIERRKTIWWLPKARARVSARARTTTPDVVRESPPVSPPQEVFHY